MGGAAPGREGPRWGHHRGITAIAWFGDTAAYAASVVRIISVGLNPSQIEFPATDPDQRFPAARGVVDACQAYLDSLNAYFSVNNRPYWRWFHTYRTLLEGMDASFDGSYGVNTAIHTDLCSPVPTSLTWSKLPKDTRKELAGPGVTLWHDLVRHLQPNVVLLSVAKKHLETIAFPSVDPEWTVLHTIEQRRRPYHVLCRRYDVDGHPVLFVWGRANMTPFGGITHQQRRDLGARIHAHLTATATTPRAA